MASYRRILSLFENNYPPDCTDCFPPAPPPFNPPPTTSGPYTAIPAIPVDIPVEYTGPPKSIQHHSVLILTVAAVLAACFLLLTYVIVLRYRSLRHRRRRRAGAQLGAADDGGDDGDSITGDDIHHVWYIRTVGLDEQTIESITICPYKKSEGLIESTDCSVCLSEFTDGELVRLLPKCSHAFHISCIDTWLRSHVNCPLCRAPIVTPAPSVPVNPAPAPALAASGGELVSSEENPALQQSSRRVSVVPEDEEGGESGIGSSSSVLESGFRVQGDLGELATTDLEGRQPVRRSVSMDFSAMGLDSKRASTMVADKVWSLAKGASTQKVPFGIERSMSTNGNKFLLSRLGRGRSISVLPL